jgi:hypothetical protein
MKRVMPEEVQTPEPTIDTAFLKAWNRAHSSMPTDAPILQDIDVWLTPYINEATGPSKNRTARIMSAAGAWRAAAFLRQMQAIAAWNADPSDLRRSAERMIEQTPVDLSTIGDINTVTEMVLSAARGICSYLPTVEDHTPKLEPYDRKRDLQMLGTLGKNIVNATVRRRKSAAAELDAMYHTFGLADRDPDDFCMIPTFDMGAVQAAVNCSDEKIGPLCDVLVTSGTIDLAILPNHTIRLGVHRHVQDAINACFKRTAK